MRWKGKISYFSKMVPPNFFWVPLQQQKATKCCFCQKSHVTPKSDQKQHFVAVMVPKKKHKIGVPFSEI